MASLRSLLASLLIGASLVACGSSSEDDGGAVGAGGAGGQGASAGQAGSGQGGAAGLGGSASGQAGSSPAVCAAGQQIACACPGTQVNGVQVCKGDGSGFGVCTGCPGGQGGAAGSGQGGSSGAQAGGSAGAAGEQAAGAAGASGGGAGGSAGASGNQAGGSAGSSGNQSGGSSGGAGEGGASGGSGAAGAAGSGQAGAGGQGAVCAAATGCMKTGVFGTSSAEQSSQGVTITITVCPDGPDPVSRRCVLEYELGQAKMTYQPVSGPDVLAEGTVPVRVVNLPYRATSTGIASTTNFRDEYSEQSTCDQDVAAFHDVHVKMTLELGADYDPAAPPTLGCTQAKLLSFQIVDDTAVSHVAVCEYNCQGNPLACGVADSLVKSQAPSRFMSELGGALGGAMTTAIEGQACLGSP